MKPNPDRREAPIAGTPEAEALIKKNLNESNFFSWLRDLVERPFAKDQPVKIKGETFHFAPERDEKSHDTP